MTAAGNELPEDCSFCSIANGTDRVVQVVCETDAWIAFFPLKPATKGHTLVIPRRHISDIWELDDPLASDLMHLPVASI